MQLGFPFSQTPSPGPPPCLDTLPRGDLAKGGWAPWKKILGQRKNTGIDTRNSCSYYQHSAAQVGDGYRGSLFSNQEFAVAYALGFERILVVNQEGILPEEMLRYIGVNTEPFAGSHNCCAVVERALDRSGWTADYSRRLTTGQLRFSNGPIQYGFLNGLFRRCFRRT